MSAGFQNQARNHVQLLVGVVNQSLVTSYETSCLSADILQVAEFCFLKEVNGLNKIVSAINSGTQTPLGIVWRSQNNNSVDIYSLGFSMNIPAGQNANVITKGTVAVLSNNSILTTQRVPVVGDVVYANADGSIITQPSSGGSTTGAATPVQTQFRVIQVTSSVPTAYNQTILISNTQNVGA